MWTLTDWPVRWILVLAMIEHPLMIAILVFVVAQVSFVGYLAWRAFRLSQQIEGITAATFLEARRVLSQHRP